MLARRNVFSLLSVLADRSHSQDVTGSVHAILSSLKILGYM